MTAPDDLCACGHPAGEHLWGYCTHVDCDCNGFEPERPAVIGEPVGVAA